MNLLQRVETLIFSDDEELIRLGAELFYQLHPHWVWYHDARHNIALGCKMVIRAQYRVTIRRLNYGERNEGEDNTDADQC